MKRITRFITLLISLTVFNLVAARAQSAPDKASATIAGRVTLDGAGAPGAHVMLKPYVSDRVIRSLIGNSGVEQPPAPTAVTDAEGRYRLTNVAPGKYRVSVFAPAQVVEGERDSLTSGKIVNVAEGDNVEDVDFSLTRGVVITGKVTDEKDRPVIAAPVKAYNLGVDGRRRSAASLSLAFVRWDTDDRGIYRIFGLEAGRYLVVADIGFGGGTGHGYLRTFHPDAVEEAQARIVEVKSGEEAANIDIKVAPMPKGYVVTGRVVERETGEPIPGVTVGYNATGRGGSGSGSGSSVTNALGEFRFLNVSPSSYRAYAFALDLNARSGGVTTIIDDIKFDVVDGDVSGLEIRAPRPATISGVVAVEGSNDPALRAKLAQVNLSLRTESRPAVLIANPLGNGVISPNGTFKLSNVHPGKTRVMMDIVGTKGVALLRVEHNGVEVKELDVNAGDQITGVRLVFACGNGVIAGRVEVKGGSQPDRMNLRYRRESGSATEEPIKFTDVDDRGEFVIENLAPGTYKLFLDVYPHGETTSKRHTIDQVVKVAGEGRHEVTFIVDLAEKEKEN
ncbi:MAG TPA: carboxypeptidase regulatory-like domain-containing protein [Blastocatellia bacterium]|nr:carboxypeptidase regulatory-like domain-containing protein [Blastocatellia bacterium]